MLKLNVEKQNYVINKIKFDDFGRPNGILLLNKPVGITSHNLVDLIREKFKTKKVGHAGALDPFASGLMVVLVGKATKLADELLSKDKVYRTRIVFGIDTDSGDIEGSIVKYNKFKFELEKVKDALFSFDGGYEQYVPVFSSVKVGGIKLRKLARSCKRFEIIQADDGREAKFFDENDNLVQKVNLPKRNVQIRDIKFLGFGEYNNLGEIFGAYLTKKTDLDEIMPTNYIDIEFSCSKGTYVRQFAKDLACKLDTFAVLNVLERKAIGDYRLEDALKVSEF